MKTFFLLLKKNSFLKASLFILLSFFLFIPDSFSQGYSVGVNPNLGEKHYYVGSLRSSDAIPHDKLKIEVFGGAVTNEYMGIQTFTISTRHGLKINREIHNDGIIFYELNVFETNIGYDFTIKVSNAWASLWIQSYLLNPKLAGGITAMSQVVVTEYNPVGKKNVTSSVTINTLIATDHRGYVGIGTDKPQSKLDVRGKIIADEVEVKVNKGADFVFKPDYSLTPLSHLETFIKQNQHLPNIPSEAEMQANGLNMSDMQIKLLQKIEELTLYVIDQDKRYDALKTENEKLESRINELEKR